MFFVATVSVNFIDVIIKISEGIHYNGKIFRKEIIQFSTMSQRKDPNLQKLKAKYDLDEVVKDSADELDKALNIMVDKYKMGYNKGSISLKEDAISILKQAENNSSFSDREFSIVFSRAHHPWVYVRKGEFRIRKST